MKPDRAGVILGYGLNCDAYHQVAPLGESVADCMRLAVADAGIEPQDVDLISAHGTGTKANDSTEAKAIHAVFGDRLPARSRWSGIWAHHGRGQRIGRDRLRDGLGAWVHPTDRDHGRDPIRNPTSTACPTTVGRGSADRADNGLAFGGNNAVVILGR